MSRRKQILFLASWYPENTDPVKGLFVRKHAIQIAQLHDVCVVYFELQDGSEYRERVVTDFPGLTEHIITICRPVSFFELLKSVVKMNRRLLKLMRESEFKFDFIHLNVVYPVGVFLYPAIMLSKLPLLITEHWSGYFLEDARYFKLAFWKKWIIANLLRRADAVTTVSDVLRKRISEVFRLTDNTVVVPNVVTIPAENKLVNKNVSNVITVLSVCTFDDMAKNISGMLKAFAVLKSEQVSLRLVLIGDGPDFDSMKGLAGDLGLGKDDVAFTGYLNASQINSWYLKADFYLLNSYFETFSISTAEALLSGLPVVATRCKGPEEYISEDCGIFVEPGDHEGLVSALKSMTANCRNYDPAMIIQQVKGKLFAGNVSGRFDEVFTKYFS